MSHNEPQEIAKIEYDFWMSKNYGLVRQRHAPGHLYHPEVWRDGKWYQGSPYVMDAITGMGEDPHSCGGWADQWILDQSIPYAAENRIDLFAEGSDDRCPPNSQTVES